MNECDCVPIKLYVCTLKFEFYVISTCINIFILLLIFFFQPCKYQSSSWVAQKLTDSRIWPAGPWCAGPRLRAKDGHQSWIQVLVISLTEGGIWGKLLSLFPLCQIGVAVSVIQGVSEIKCKSTS